MPGKVFIDVNLKEGVQLPLGPAPVPASDHAAMDPQVAEQMLVIAVHRTLETLSKSVKVLELVAILRSVVYNSQSK